MTKNEKVFDLIEKTGLNWTVNKESLVSVSGLKTGSYGIFRNDTNEWLGTTKAQYLPLQNFEMAEILVNVTEGIGLEVTRGGSLDGGVKVYLQAELPEVHIGKSDVKRWITCLNSHNGRSSVGFGSTNTTVVCSNTFHHVYREIEKIRHTQTMKERIAIAQEELKNALAYDKQLVSTFKKMAEVEMRDEAVERVIKRIFNVDEKTKDIATQTKNRIEAFGDAVTTSVNEQGKTIWALFNGVTRFTNHFAAPEDESRRDAYLMTKKGAKISNIGFNELLKYVEEHTAKAKVAVTK